MKNDDATDSPPLAAIVAMAHNGVIGRDGDLPWHLSSDLKRFRALTTGHVLLMGRRTWESIGRPLPGRHIVVLTRREPAGTRLAERVVTERDVSGALARIEAGFGPAGATVFVAGGVSLYEECLPAVEVLHLTRVQAEMVGDAVLELDLTGWRVVEARFCPAGDDDEHPSTYWHLVRGAPGRARVEAESW